MKQVRRYWVDELDETWADTKFVLNSDYCALESKLQALIDAGEAFAGALRTPGADPRWWVYEKLAPFESAIAKAKESI